MMGFGLARIGRDVEVRNTPGGDAVANVSLAFSYGRKDGEGNKPTQWVDASLWGQRATALAPYLKKGGMVSVTLEDVAIQTFAKADQTQGHKLVGRIAQIELANKGPSAAPAAPPPAPRPHRPPAARPVSASLDDMDDDIPF